MATDTPTDSTEKTVNPTTKQPVAGQPLAKEIGGVTGPEPTRYGDWEHKGRCTDF
jgi:hypothetical protein